LVQQFRLIILLSRVVAVAGQVTTTELWVVAAVLADFVAQLQQQVVAVV
jgi:hypothetical protein